MISLCPQYFAITINTNKYNSTSHYSLNKLSMSCDKVSFEGRKDLLDCTSLVITRKVRNAVQNDDNILGCGGTGTVYKIPGTNYCVKIFFNNDLHYFGNWNFNISKSDKVNHVVAKADNGAELMHLISGKALSWRDDISGIFSLPNKCYKDLIMQIVEAKNDKMVFDPNSRNIIYDENKQSLIAIDFVDSSKFNESFTPIYSVFDALRDFHATAEAKYHNRQLFCKIMDTILDEMDKKTKPDFPIKYADLGLIFRKICANDNLHEYKLFANILRRAIKFKDLVSQGTNCSDELSQAIIQLKMLMNKILLIPSENK